MTTEQALLHDVLLVLRQQISPDLLEQLALLALEDQTMFITEVVSSAKSERLHLPDQLVSELEEELYRIPTFADPSDTDRPAPPPDSLDLDLVAIRQRQVDDVAQQLRRRHRRSASGAGRDV